MAEVGRGRPTSAGRAPRTRTGGSLVPRGETATSEIEVVSTRDFPPAAPATSATATSSDNSDNSDNSDKQAPTSTRRWWHIPRFLRRGIVIIIVLLIVEYLVIPELLLAKRSIHALEHVNIALLLLGLALEVLAQVAYARLTLVLLPPNSLSFSKTIRINVAALSVSHVLPGGTAGGTGLGYRLMTSSGVKGTDVAFQAATQGIGSAVVLNAMLWLALVISIPLNGFRPVYVTVAIVTAVLLALFAALVFGFADGQGWAANALRRLGRRVRFIGEDRMENAVGHIALRLKSLGQNRSLLLRGVVWAASNWLLDAACLWVCLAAFNYALDPIDLFVAYGVGNVLAAIPLTPGGLGPVEAAVPAVLRGFGVPLGIGALAVLGWRLFNFWLPIPVGAGCWVSLRVGRGATWTERRAALGSLTTEARVATTSQNGDAGGAVDSGSAEGGSAAGGSTGGGSPTTDAGVGDRAAGNASDARAGGDSGTSEGDAVLRQPRWFARLDRSRLFARLDRWGWFAERR